MSVDITISYILRFLLVLIFLRSVLHKLSDYHQFCSELKSYRIVPEYLSRVFAPSLLFLEGYCALTLLIQGWLHPAIIGATLLALYAFAMSINLARGRTDIDCGCSTALVFRQSISWALVARNMALTGIALVGVLPVVSRDLAPLDAVTIACASVAIMFVYGSIEQALANGQRRRHYFSLRADITGISS